MSSLFKRVLFSGLSLALVSCLTACGGGDSGFFDSPSPIQGSSSTRATLQSIVVQADKSSVPAGGQVTLQAIGHFSDGSTADIAGNSSVDFSKAFTSVNWNASPVAVATFSYPSSNKLDTRVPGTVVVTAKDSFSGLIGTTTITVTAPVQTLLSISGMADNQTISARTGAQLAAVIVSTDSSTTTATSVIWASSNPSVATVDSGGNFQGAGAGSVTITATTGSFSKSIRLTLLKPLSSPLVTISCDPAHPTAIDAQQWNNQFSIDKVNATEWVAVDGASCQSYPVIEALVQAGPSSPDYYTRFYANRSPANPAIFQPGTVLSTLGAGEAISIGSSISFSDDYFTLLYTILTK